MVDIKNVVILGDSLSDIGNKWLTFTGQLGRLFGAMRVNETGRYSDGKNWTDFLVEWATGESLMWGNADLTIRKSMDYRSLQRYSVLEVDDTWDRPLQPRPPKDLDDYLADLAEAKRKKATAKRAPQIRYVNYAEGGCLASRDWTIPPMLGALTYLKSQVEDYIAQRRLLDSPPAGAMAHIVWIGLNDFVTVARPDYDRGTVKNLPEPQDYGAWLDWSHAHPDDLTNGAGVFPAVAEVQSLVELINSRFPDARADHHFILVDLPSVYHAIRYMKGLTDPKKAAQAEKFDRVIQSYNAMLQSLVRHWPAGPDKPHHVHLVQMSLWMDYVGEHLDEWQLLEHAQDPGVPTCYHPAIPAGRDRVPPSMRRRITTSDLAHPTEAVYSIMARYFVTRLLQEGYTLGRLTNDTWRQNAPFSDLPFDVPG